MAAPLRFILVVSIIVVSGCIYESPFDVACEYEGAIHEGRVCQGGYWVATPDAEAAADPNCFDCNAMPVVTPPVMRPPAVDESNALRITFHRPGPVDIEDFVALVEVHASSLVGGSGVQFLDARGLPLAHEVEAYEVLSGRVLAWVRLPVLRADGTTTISLVQGDSGVPADEVWTGYEMVFHMGEDVFDSTGGSAPEDHGSVAAEGVVGYGRSFDGLDQYVDTKNKRNLDEWSVSLWVQAPDEPMTSEGPNGPLMREGNYQILWDNSEDQLIGAASVKTGKDVFDASFGMLNGGQWHYLAATYDGEELRSYRDGALATANDMPQGKAAHAKETATIGRTAKKSDEPYAFFGGLVDEVRVFDGVRPASSIETSHRNQRDPSAFYTVTVIEWP